MSGACKRISLVGNARFVCSFHVLDGLQVEPGSSNQSTLLYNNIGAHYTVMCYVHTE